MINQYQRYFAFKTGSGNCYSALALSGHPGVTEPGERLLYVGFSDLVDEDALQRLPSPVRKDHIALRVRDGLSAHFEPHVPSNAAHRTAPDDNWIAWILHPLNRERCVLVTFFPLKFYFWRAVEQSELVVARWDEAEDSPLRALYVRAAKAMSPAEREFPRKAMLRSKPGSVERLAWQADDLKAPPLFKFMRVRKVGSVERRSLYTAVDSLSGDQNVIRRTCPPLWRVTGSNPARGDCSVLDESRSISGVPTHLSVSKETRFGTFLRLYFNGLLGYQPNLRSAVDGVTSARPLSTTDETDWWKLASATFNPILLETAAYYFCLDLGGQDAGSNRAALLPDVGVGKGLAVIDVRARVRPDSDSLKQQVSRRLQALMSRLGGTAHPKTISALEDNGVLELQCKGARSQISAKVPALVFFGHGGDTGDLEATRTQILLRKLLVDVAGHSEEWPLLHEFMRMQADNLRASASP